MPALSLSRRLPGHGEGRLGGSLGEGSRSQGIVHSGPVTPSRTRLLSPLVTALAVAVGGFEAHLAPQTDGWWHGITGSFSPGQILAGICAGSLVWVMGGAVRVGVLSWMGLAFLPLLPALTGFGAPLLLFGRFTVLLLFVILIFVSGKDLLPRISGLSPLRAFVISFVFFVVVGRFIPGPAGPQGDEPHYLLIAESLLQDGDVDLMNQFETRAFSKFTSASLEPHAAPRSHKGKLYAIHTPGLPALIAPGYALFGYAGARAVVSLVMAGVVALLFFAARQTLGGEAAACVFVFATFASPLPIYANSLFPDSVATLALAATFAAMVGESAGLNGLASLSIASLPWLHPRFLPLAAFLTGALILRRGASARSVGVFAGPLVFSIAGLLAHFQSLFGSASISAAYGPNFASDVSIARIPWGASALVLDRQFGLLLFSPFLLLGLPGLMTWWTQDRRMSWLLAGAVGAFAATGGAFSMWWGGASPPARFLAGATPALLLIAAARWREGETKPALRRCLSAAGGFGFGLVVLACLAPRALHNRADGASGLLRLLSPVLDLDRFFPGFVSGETSGAMAVAWGLALLVIIFWPRLGVLGLALPVVLGAITVKEPLLDPFAASLKGVEAWNDHPRTFGGHDDPTAFELRIPLGSPSWDLSSGVIKMSPRFSLPRGGWTLDVGSTTEPVPGALNVARVLIVDDKETAVASAWVRLGEPRSLERFELAEDERRLRVRGEGLQATTRILTIGVTPRLLGR